MSTSTTHPIRCAVRGCPFRLTQGNVCRDHSIDVFVDVAKLYTDDDHLQPAPLRQHCTVCGRQMTALSSRRMYCGDACKARAYRSSLTGAKT